MNFFDKLLGRSDIHFNDDIYMRRWRIIHTRYFGIRVHNIMRSDMDVELHDHPFTFVSFILRGGYFEITPDGLRTWYGPGSLVVRSGAALHRLELDRPAWTLVFRGPMTRVWGFLTSSGWVPWSKFVVECNGDDHRRVQK